MENPEQQKARLGNEAPRNRLRISPSLADLLCSGFSPSRLIQPPIRSRAFLPRETLPPRGQIIGEPSLICLKSKPGARNREAIDRVR